MSHPPLAQLSTGTQSKEITGDARLISAADGGAATDATPYGSFNTTTLGVLAPSGC